MKKTAYIFLFFFLLSCHSKPSKQQNVDSKSLKPTEITFEKDAHNFGKLKAGETVAYTFTFTNTGKYGLKIESVETDCGCLTVDFTDTYIKPGAKGKIDVEFNSSGMFGREYKSIIINANTEKPKQISIFAEVENNQIKYN